MNTAAVITISDKGSRGQRTDTSGPALREILEIDGWQVVYTSIIPDEAEDIKRELIKCSDSLGVSLILTTGGTGFSPRDVTPEAAMEVIQRLTPGIPEAMRAESMKITPNGCLSRSIAGIRGKTLIVTLPGSEKAARENIQAVLKPIRHGVDMINSQGSADCADTARAGEKAPSMDQWLREAKSVPGASDCGMYLFHNGVVRGTAKRQVREGAASPQVQAMSFSYDSGLVDRAVETAKKQEGIFHVRVWLNKGRLQVGDDIMLVLVGGDTRPHVTDALQSLVKEIKTNCVKEEEIF